MPPHLPEPAHLVPGPGSRHAALLPAGALWAARPAPTAGRRAQAATFDLIWNEWGPLNGYGVSAECNPGGTTSFACGPADVGITPGSDPTSQFSNVTANPRGALTFVNAIGNIHFTNDTPDGQPVQLTTYRYLYWKLNPWDPSYGHIFAYTTDSSSKTRSSTAWPDGEGRPAAPVTHWGWP